MMNPFDLELDVLFDHALAGDNIAWEELHERHSDIIDVPPNPYAPPPAASPSHPIPTPDA